MSRIYFYISFLFIVLVQANAQNAKQHLKAADVLVDNGLYKNAVDEYSKAIESDPKYGEAYAGRAKALLELKDSIHAAKDYQLAAVFGEAPSENFVRAAKIFYQLKSYNKALLAINKAIEVKSKNYEAYLLQSEIFLKKNVYDLAYEASSNALDAKTSAMGFYLRGQAAMGLNNISQAEIDFEKAIIRDELFYEAFLKMAEMQMTIGKTNRALENCNYVILHDKNNVQAHVLRSKIYSEQKDYPKAIADISKAIVNNHSSLNFYGLRAAYYMKNGQSAEAVKDYSHILNSDILNIEALKNRALAYEKLGDKKKTISDYSLLSTLMDEDEVGKEVITSIEEKLYELRKEGNAPKISIASPVVNESMEVMVPGNIKKIQVRGKIQDENKIKLIRINSDTISLDYTPGKEQEFTAMINPHGMDLLTISAIDDYDNIATLSYAVRTIENNKPQIAISTPYVSDDQLIKLNPDEKILYLEGEIKDESKIQEIKIDNVNASYVPDAKNPKFTATIDLTNKTRIEVKAIDVHGNVTSKLFPLVFKGQTQSAQSPVGKTWAIFIANSNYKEFNSLSSPKDDVAKLRKALTHYRIDKIIYKEEMTKREMERFFSIDLRDLIRANEVKSLFIWYAGHGENINGDGYWIPVDAIKNEEFSYYNINALKASIYSYRTLDHLLVVSDACATGSSFNEITRGNLEPKSCSDVDLIKKKSAQILNSSGQGSAADDSQFANAFANSLLNNENDCISIDKIAYRIGLIFEENSPQKPQFGRIRGVPDEEGTFFFIAH